MLKESMTSLSPLNVLALFGILGFAFICLAIGIYIGWGMGWEAARMAISSGY